MEWSCDAHALWELERLAYGDPFAIESCCEAGGIGAGGLASARAKRHHGFREESSLMLTQGFPDVESPSTMAEDGRRAEIIGRSPIMVALARDLETIGRSDAMVLIEGETGVGKNLVARALHRLGPRSTGPFVSLNAANLPTELFESELFGHVKGAFTGAYGDHLGLARAADGGTLFLDEIGELSPVMQAKLLCFLDTQTVRPVGGLRATHVNVRVVCATNRDLPQCVREGRFRRDLYYRLRVIALRVPSLRERRTDIPLLAAYFLGRSNRRYRKHIPKIAPAALARLEAHPWEGNVRELENEIERAVVLTPDREPIDETTLSLPTMVPADKEEGGSVLEVSRQAAERDVIARALDRHRWNVSATARELGISRVGLTRKLKRLGLERPR